MAKRRGDRFPLLVYAPLGRRWTSLGLLLMLTSGALWWLAPRILGPTPWRHLALFPVLAGGALFIYGLAARKMAYVQCFPTYLRIQTPFYPLVISYRRVLGTRPVQVGAIFDPQKDRAARRSWPRGYWAKTALALELKGLPVKRWWLRLWFDRHLFLPEGSGLVLFVEDWMGLSAQLDSFRVAYRARQ